MTFIKAGYIKLKDKDILKQTSDLTIANNLSTHYDNSNEEELWLQDFTKEDLNYLVKIGVISEYEKEQLIENEACSIIFY